MDDRQLPPDVRDLLITLARAAQRAGLYPSGHPAVGPMVERVRDALAAVLEERDEPLAIGVSRDALVLDAGETDPDDPTLRNLAARLHGHELAGVTFRPTPGPEELEAFLDGIAEPPEGEAGALGERPRMDEQWPRIALEPLRYERLALSEDDGQERRAAEEEAGRRAEELWRGLGRLALTEAALEGSAADLPEASRIVTALDRFSRDEAEARSAAGRLAAVARSVEGPGGSASPEVRERLLEVVETADPELLQRIFASSTAAVRRSFLHASAGWMPVEDVMEMLERAADQEELDFSHHVLGLLARLAGRAADEETEGGADAEAAFREEVRELVGGWDEELEAPDGAGEAPLPELSAPAGAGWRGLAGSVDPGRVVRTVLELDHRGPAEERAVEEMLEREGPAALLELLRAAPADGSTAEAILDRVGADAFLREILAGESPDWEAVEAFVDRLGTGAAGPLLDALAEAGDRSVRRRLFSRLVELEGEEVGEAAVERLRDERWYVKRNMLALLAERATLPSGFSPMDHVDHPRAAVRREAYRIALRHPEVSGEAIRRGMADQDSKVSGMVFGLLGELDPDVLERLLPTLLERVRDGSLADGSGRAAVRALSRVDRPEALRALLSLCRSRSWRSLWRTRLAEKSPAMLEALRGLARCWSDRPEARTVLEAARSSDDPEIREAAR